MTTEKQIKANRKNAQKSTGPKTSEGKDKASKNSQVHGILSNVFTGEDEEYIEDVKEKLKEDPQAILEDQLRERAAIWMLRLDRAKVFEREWIKEKLDPPEVESGFELDMPEKKVTHEGSPATIKGNDLEDLVDTVYRYEKTAENRLVKFINLLQELGIWENEDQQ